MNSSSPPRISIVIPVFNAAPHIEECLERIFASEFKEFEVILVDDGSTDDTVKKAASLPCRVIRNEGRRGAGASRNRGVKEARGEIILLIDSDVLIPSDLLGKIWQFFEEHSAVSLLQARYEDRPYYRNLFSQYKHYIFSFRGAAEKFGPVNYVHTACVAVKKNVFQKIQFDERLSRREDVEFGLRCAQNGFLIYTDPGLRVGHKKKYDWLSFSRYQFTAARQLALQYFTAHDRSFSLEICSGRAPFHKAAWLLRPFLSLLAILSLIAGLFLGGDFSLICLAGLLIISFLLEYRFRLYLFRMASITVSLSAWWLYFYDGLLAGLGAAVGMGEALMARRQDETKKAPSGGMRKRRHRPSPPL